MKKQCKTALIIISIFLSLIVIIIGPIIINELYMKNDGYLTKWGAEEVLSYYGNVLSFIGTVLLGVVTVRLSKQANNMNKRMLDLELSKTKPCLIPNSKCYNFYVGKDISIQTDSVKTLTDDSVTIQLLFITEPRSGITTSIATLAVDFVNSGNSDIISAFINKIEFRLSTKHSLIPYKNAFIVGNTNFKISETKRVLFEFKQEFFEEQKDKIVEIDINDTDILPYINMELILISQEGYRYRETLCIESNVVVDNNNKKRKCLRSFSITNFNIEMEDTQNA